MPKPVFHVVAEDPQIKQVAAQVNPPGMHEHGREERHKISAGIGQKAAGDKGPLHDERIAAAQLYEEKQDIQGDPLCVYNE